MSDLHLIRTGTLGQVGRYPAVDARRYPRGARVVVRTERGLEVGEVLGSDASESLERPVAGQLLRGMTVEDDLIQARIEQHRDRAYDACAARLRELGVPTTLVDVEHLFDGQSLVFHFLGPEPSELERLIDELAETYDAKVQFRAFTDTLTQGCGPGCGTEAATGGGCSSCATGCAIAGACGSGAKTTSATHHG